MDELNPTVREQEIYEEMELTPEMVKSIRTLCGTCLRHFVDAKAFKIALVPSADRSMDTCTVCQMRRGYDFMWSCTADACAGFSVVEKPIPNHTTIP